MGTRRPFAAPFHGVHATSQDPACVYRLQVWLDDAGWTEVKAEWDAQVDWHYRAHVRPTDFTWLACAEQVAQAIAENCGVPVTIATTARQSACEQSA